MAFFSRIRHALYQSPAPSSAFQSQFALGRFYSTLTSPKLFVSGLSRQTTDEKLKEAFAPFGKLLEEAEKAKEGMNAKFLDGWVIFVDPARPREQRPPPQPEPQQSETGFRTNKTVGWCG
ncbi:hypothetical protein CRG98_017477 [Punica granatum]|uniref:RRM domain-containing protein n=1 Tax=Punica granatum TaxID=22663 RepID=A0A2I0K0K9_PUNGR|nr:hypothetical protein CRG98_017477 [Punica granatum]